MYKDPWDMLRDERNKVQKMEAALRAVDEYMAYQWLKADSGMCSYDSAKAAAIHSMVLDALCEEKPSECSTL